MFISMLSLSRAQHHNLEGVVVHKHTSSKTGDEMYGIVSIHLQYLYINSYITEGQARLSIYSRAC